jgi:hypothetical protein
MLPARKDNGAAATALRLLKTKLGKDSVLLDHIPIDKVEMVVQHDEGQETCIAHKIRLGTFPDEDGDKPWPVWVYISAARRKDELREVEAIAFHPYNGKSKSHAQEEIMSKCKLQDEFKPAAVTRKTLFALVKVMRSTSGSCLEPCQLTTV